MIFYADRLGGPCPHILNELLDALHMSKVLALDWKYGIQWIIF